MMNIKNNVELNKNEYNNIFYDKRILPLFKNPINLKKIKDQNKNNINLNIINYKKDINLKLISFKEIINILLKGINLYNDKLNNYLKYNNKKELILQIKNNEIYKINNKIANYFYIVNRFFPFFKKNSLLRNRLLFSPKQFYRIQPYFRFKHRYKSIVKLYQINSIYTSKIERARYNRDLINLFNKGKEIIKEIDTQIMLKKNINNYLKNKDKILKFINSLSKINKDNLNYFNNYNFNNINSVINNQTNLNKTKESKLNEKNKDSQNLNINLNTNLKENFDIVKNNRNQLIIHENKLLINKIFNPFKINKTNEIKIEQTFKSIFKNKEFNSKYEAVSIKHNPVEMLYYNDNNNNYYNNNLINNSSILSENLQKKPIINQYLKSMSNFNIIKKGILISYSNIIGFNFKTENNKLIKDIYKLLAGSFKSMYCLISKPVFVMTPDKLIIQLFYYLFIPNILKFKKFFKYRNRNKFNKKIWFKRKKIIRKQYRKFRKIKINVRIKLRKLSNVVITKIFKLKFKKLCDILSHLFNKPVQLDLIRLHYPYNDSNILVNLLGIMINKIKLRIIFRKLFEKAIIKNLNKVNGNNKFNLLPAFLSGINIRVAGRLLTHRVIPRKTVKTIRRGAAATGKINFSDVARYTNKNKRGTFSITVSSGHNFFN